MLSPILPTGKLLLQVDLPAPGARIVGRTAKDHGAFISLTLRKLTYARLYAICRGLQTILPFRRTEHFSRPRSREALACVCTARAIFPLRLRTATMASLG